MSGASIARPLPFSVAGTGIVGTNRLLTHEPKEVAVASGGAATLSFDLGSPQSIDTIFVGFTNDAGAGALQFSYGPGNAFTINLGAARGALSTKLFSPRRHFAVQLDAPVTARFVGIAGNLPAGFEIGVVAIGRAFVPALGHEQGAGRPIIATGSTARRPDGGFGTSRGAGAGGFAWTYGDLSDDERDELYAILRDRLTDAPVLVIEETGAASAARAEQFHWGLFTRIEQFERKAAESKTMWSLRIEDWE